MPKAADHRLITTTRPAVAAINEDHRQLRKALARATFDTFLVTMTHWTGSDEPDAGIWIEFMVQVRDGWPTISNWAIRGVGEASTGRSRFPLRTYARAALLAVEDALAADDQTHEDIMRDEFPAIGSLSTGWVSRDFRVTDGRLDDPRAQGRRSAPQHRTRRTQPMAERAERAAVEYRAAIARGSRSPTQDVARILNVGRSTAARAIAEARQRGLLGPALNTYAGEQT